MTVEILRATLGWVAVFNLGLLAVWLLFFMAAHDWVYRLHGRWFDIPAQRFDAIHYACMAFYKLATLLFVITPYLALRIVA
jgi:Family of unknown function (DUF6868)